MRHYLWQRIWHFVILLAVGSTHLLWLSPSFALNLTREVYSHDAENGEVLTVWEAGGTNIDFSQTNEVIQRVWLDDPSRLTIDFDGDLTAGGAYVVHLRRLQGVSFENIPQTDTTLLTVVTVTAGQPESRNVYLFQIAYGSGDADYNNVRIVHAAPSGQVNVGTGQINLEALQTGLQTAVARSIIPENSEVIARVNTFVQLVEAGRSVEEALTEAQIPIEVLQQLSRIGSE